MNDEDRIQFAQEMMNILRESKEGVDGLTIKRAFLGAQIQMLQSTVEAIGHHFSVPNVPLPIEKHKETFTEMLKTMVETFSDI